MTHIEADISHRRHRATQLMQVNCRRLGLSAVAVASGTIHASNAALLEQVVDAAARDGLRLVVVDVAAVTSVDQDGRRVLAALSNRTDLLVIVREGSARPRDVNVLGASASSRAGEDFIARA